MKQIYYILLLLFMMLSCKNEDYFYNATNDSVNSSMWDYLSAEPSHSYFMSLVSKYQLDTLANSNSPLTLFIPTDEALEQMDTSGVDMSILLSYLFVPTIVNVQSFTTSNKVQTQSLKFALIEYDATSGTYAYDGIPIEHTSPMYNDGQFYGLEDVVMPAPNLYEYISETSSVFKKFIDLQDSLYFDIDASTPIAFGIGGTTYDSVFASVNLFYRDYFPVGEEYRNTTATFTLFSQEQYDAALEIMKLDLKTDFIPEVWQNEILMPALVSNNIFTNSLQYSEFEPSMVNINGDSINVNVQNIDPASRYICSNGVVFSLTDFLIPDSLYKSQSKINGVDLVTELIAGEDWIWNSDVSLEGRYATDANPALTDLDEAINEKVLSVDLAGISEDTLRFNFFQKGVFGAEKYRLIWAGSNTYCGQYKIYINGTPLQMRDEKGKNSDYFDSYMFVGVNSRGVIKSTTGLSAFTGSKGYNSIDFKVENIAEYTDVQITFEYLGPSKTSRGVVRGSPGLVIDYLQLEMYD